MTMRWWWNLADDNYFNAVINLDYKIFCRIKSTCDTFANPMLGPINATLMVRVRTNLICDLVKQVCNQTINVSHINTMNRGGIWEAREQQCWVVTLGNKSSLSVLVFTSTTLITARVQIPCLVQIENPFWTNQGVLHGREDFFFLFINAMGCDISPHVAPLIGLNKGSVSLQYHI